MNEYNPFSLKNKVILVTGASSGIGRSVAVECSKFGAEVYLTARNKERLEETLKLMFQPKNHHVLCADLSLDEDIELLVNSFDKKLDGVVQCAGYTVLKPYKFYSKKDIDGVMGVNFFAPFFLTQKLYKINKIKRKASIVFISSISGIYISSIGGSLYSASKGAINGAVKGIAIEFASKGIRVNCVNPGMIDTEIFKDDIISEEQIKKDVERYPLKRYGKPNEVACGVVYLLSDASAWTTGSNLLIDGGYTLQ